MRAGLSRADRAGSPTGTPSVHGCVEPRRSRERDEPGPTSVLRVWSRAGGGRSEDPSTPGQPRDPRCRAREPFCRARFAQRERSRSSSCSTSSGNRSISDAARRDIEAAPGAASSTVCRPESSGFKSALLWSAIATRVAHARTSRCSRLGRACIPTVHVHVHVHVTCACTARLE